MQGNRSPLLSFGLYNHPKNSNIDEIVTVMNTALSDANCILGEHLYTQVFHRMGLALALLDQAGHIQHINSSFSQTFGYTQEELWQQSIHRLLPSDDAPPFLWRELLAQCQTSGRPREYRFMHRRGYPLWAQLSLNILHATEGQPLLYVLQCLDITHQKEMEAEIHQQHVLFSQFIRHTPLALAMFDRDMRYLACSQRWLSDYQLIEQDILGRSHYDVFPTIRQQHPHWIALHQRSLQGDVIECDREEFINNKGESEWLQYHLMPWRDANGTIGGMVMFTENITHRVQEEQRTLQENKQQSLQAMAGGVAHEVNNLLQPVLTYAELAVEDFSQTDERLTRYLGNVLQYTKKAATIIQDVLIYSRQHDRLNQPTDMMQATSAAFVFIRALLPSSIELKLQAGTAPSCKVWCNDGS